jgi:hypothetical protein
MMRVKLHFPSLLAGIMVPITGYMLVRNAWELLPAMVVWGAVFVTYVFTSEEGR